MTHGTVKFFNAAKGFGFITPDSGGKDIFVSAASASSAGIGILKPGQRVSFDIKPDTRGPMAVGLSQLAEPPRQLPTQHRAPPDSQAEERRQLVFYFDSADDNAQAALEKLRAAGHEPKLVDYVASPLTREQLKALSALLAAKSQGLVKKYAPLFYDLRLDDRFLSQTEFWDAIVEHPSLINGPIVATASDANLCNAKSGVKTFLAANFPHLVPVDVGQTEPAKPPKHAPAMDEDESESEAAGPTAAKAPKARAAKKAKAAVAPKAKAISPAKPKATAKKAATKPAKPLGVKKTKPRSKN